MDETIKNNTAEILINLDETSSNTLEKNAFQRSTFTRRSPTSGGNPKPTEVGAWRLKMRVLEEAIRELHELVISKKNVHHEIKDKTTRVKVKMAEARDAAKDVNWGEGQMPTQETARSLATQATQTDKPAGKRAETPLSVRVLTRANNTEKRKRETEAEQKERSPKQRRRGGSSMMETPRTTRKDDKPQKEKGRTITRRQRADAIVVQTTGATSYADILRKVKTDPALVEMGEKVIRIKRNQKGQMMFELKREEDAKRADLQEAVSKALGEVATVTMRTQEVNIVCKDMDEVTTKEELLEALEKEFGINSIPLTAVRSMRTSFAETQTAIISLPFEQAKKALAVGKVKIGWTICRLREATKPRMCFRCLDFGHMAKDCKNEDRSKRCRRCGGEGHIAKDCTKDPQCMLCKAGDKPAPHITGSGRCPKFRSATKSDKS